MKIFLKEISEQGTDFDFTQEESWLSSAVEQIDETMEGETAGSPNQLNWASSRPVDSHLSLRNVDGVIVVSGAINTQLRLICSRCASYFPYDAKRRFSALYCKDPVMAGEARFEAGEAPVGRTKGHAFHSKHLSQGFTGDEIESGQDLDITYIAEDFIDLSALLKEQLRLNVPFQPLCNEECKGICTHCGADLNVGRCACSKIVKRTPFSVLKDIKVNR